MSNTYWEQYLSDEDKRQIAEDVFRKRILQHWEDSGKLQQLLGNVAYDVVWRRCDEELSNDLAATLKANVVKVVQGLGHFEVFSKPNAWDREPNAMYAFLQQCIKEQQPRVKAIVEQNVSTQTVEALKSNLNEFIIEVVQELYKTKGEKHVT